MTIRLNTCLIGGPELNTSRTKLEPNPNKTRAESYPEYELQPTIDPISGGSDAAVSTKRHMLTMRHSDIFDN